MMTTSDDHPNPAPFLMPRRVPLWGRHDRQSPSATGRIVGFRPPVARCDRTSDLVRLLPLWPEELADTSIAGRTKLVQLLERALRAERQRGVGGHWTYDLSRHASLMWALREERAALNELVVPRPTAPKSPMAPKSPTAPKSPSERRPHRNTVANRQQVS
jgi:hypothetical protein